MRLLMLSLALTAMVLSACSDAGSVGSTTAADPASSTSVSPTSSLPDTSTTLEDDTTETTSGRPLAPDFTLALGEGGTYRLSDGAKPVYLVFWAEW